MNDEEQKRIFAKNLNHYISLNGKQQKEVANDLGIGASTFNTWCKGKALPSVGKIQKLADYFRIGKSDLTDEKISKDSELEFTDVILKIALTDKRFAKIITEYSKLPNDKKDIVCEIFEKLLFK